MEDHFHAFYVNPNIISYLFIFFLDYLLICLFVCLFCYYSAFEFSMLTVLGIDMLVSELVHLNIWLHERVILADFPQNF